MHIAIAMTLYPYTVWTRRSCQAASPTAWKWGYTSVGVDNPTPVAVLQTHFGMCLSTGFVDTHILNGVTHGI